MSKAKKTSIKNLLFQKKPVGVILSLHGCEGKYPAKIAKEIDCTYTHTLKILGILKSNGIVEFKKQGRIKEVALTNKGKGLASDIKSLADKFFK
ncbi:hypothetical protein ACFLRC_01200 [Candidatus Altiarchaeota archaeon]